MKVVNKKGISLIVLVITIIVSLILVSIGVAATGNAIENANITEYIDNLNLVKDSVESYYISNGEFPISDTYAYNQGEIISLVSESKNSQEVETFIYDLRQTEDYYDSDELGEFYIIDLNKLGIEKSEIGNGVKSKLDIFVFSYPSMNIYYLEGMKLKNDVYYTLSKRLTYISNVSYSKDEADKSSGVDVEIYDGVTITKSAAKWTNDLKLSISGDNLSIRLAGSSTFHNLRTDTTVKTIEEFNTKNALTSNFSATEISNFNVLSSSLRYIEIKNNNSGSIFKVDLSNYDNKAPKINSCNITNNSEMSIVSYSLEDYDSGIKEIRYDYLTKFDDSGNIVDYYSGVNLDKNYMLTKAKKVRAFGGTNVSIKVPNNVNKIRVYVIDNAGNIIIEENRVVKENFITISSNINYFYTDGFNFSLDISGTYSSIEVTATTDNDSADLVRSYSTIPTNAEFRGFNAGINNLYLKVKVVSTVNGKQQETVKTDKFSLMGNYPYVPSGFYYVGGTVDTGFIISDNANDKEKGQSYEVASSLVGNQFVWIPVDIDSSSVQNLKTKWFRAEFESGSEYTYTAIKSVLNTNYLEPASVATSEERKLYNNMMSSVQKYKGFYVGRFEAGAANATSARTAAGKSTVNTVGIRRGLYLYNYVAFGNSMTDFSSGATYLANNMYNTSYVGSNLIFGIQWDEIMKFVDKNVSNSISWGNYSNSIGDAATNKGAGEYKTGTNEAWQSKNIYDLAGNVAEWTMEAYQSDARVTRGGSFQRNGSTNSAGVRTSFIPTTTDSAIGFRVCLYFK